MVTLIAYISPKRYTKLYILFNNANFLVIIFFRHDSKHKRDLSPKDNNEVSATTTLAHHPWLRPFGLQATEKKDCQPC